MSRVLFRKSEITFETASLLLTGLTHAQYEEQFKLVWVEGVLLVTGLLE